MKSPQALIELSLGPHDICDLPDETLEILQQGNASRYLDSLSQLALRASYTATVFITHEPIFVEICSRWLTAPATDDLAACAALALLLPSASYLSGYVQKLLDREKHRALRALRLGKAAALQDISEDELYTLLLTLYRCLTYDNDSFASAVSPAQIQLLLKHPRKGIRYFAIRILCLYLHASDAVWESMVKTYIGEEKILDEWEDKIIDLTFLNLWERKRTENIHESLQKRGHADTVKRAHSHVTSVPVTITHGELSYTSACVGGVLLPRLSGKITAKSSIVMTRTVRQNMGCLAEGLKVSSPLLVTGLSGSGKSFLIREAARELGEETKLVTLHLNEQTDAKLLIGMYTSQTPGSFTWRPGVLTSAVIEGRWVLIEGLDRAPAEITSVLLPLLERRELLVPNWGETIRASPSFKLIATVRSTFNARGEEYIPTANMIGIRHWRHVSFQVPSEPELQEIIIDQHPTLRAYMSQFMSVYHDITPPFSSSLSTTSDMRRLPGPQELFKWCARVDHLLLAAGIRSSGEPFPDALIDEFFLEAIDCFLGFVPSGTARSEYTDIIAQGLHIAAGRAQYCLDARKATYLMTETSLQIGRAVLPRRKRAQGAKVPIQSSSARPFARTNHVLRILESVAVTARQAEPCLLVGETGTGKTTIVQWLADALDKKLTVVNLSQQSEAGDLLGGFKPVNLRALAIPIQEEFSDLMETTFPSQRNQHYVETLGKSVSKGRWTRSLTLWQEALRTIDAHLEPVISSAERTEPDSKRRRLKSPKAQKLKTRWDRFASEVQTFQMHLASNSKGFAFSFVEGNIIKAARNGEWVLLDEINLASSDTLESLADLFSSGSHGNPSILLTESGETEKIVAHSDFRIFGAMNPATDVGKRDLPQGIRSKFTEIFVEAPDKDLDNLVPVVKAYLGNHSNADVRAATDIASLYLDIKKLEEQNNLVDGANQKPHFSLRTLSRTMSYVLDIAPLYGLRRALYEGFSMSFLTVLDKASELLVQRLIEKHLLAPQTNLRALLHQTPKRPYGDKRYVGFKHYWIAAGPRPSQEQAHYIITPFIERNLLNLVRAASTRKFPVLLQGPTSSGKTSMVEYLARISGNHFVRINNHEHTDLQEYLGTYVSGPDGRLQFQEGVLVNALREGHWIVLDELNLAPTDVLEALNRLLDDNRELLVPETQQVIRPHENFMLFATQNPPGAYGGRKSLSRAFRNRFLELHFDDIPENELGEILEKRSQIAPSFCKSIVTVYQRLSVLRQSDRLFEQKNSFATLRDLFRWASRDAENREQLATNGFLLLAERVRNPEERLAVKRVIEDVMRVKIDIDQVYDTSKVEAALASSLAPVGHIVWTKSMRRLAVLVAEALKAQEPVLLVGDTGSGKTTICQVIAEVMQTKLHILNAHQNLETGDMIGTQRPVRDRANVEAQLAQDLIAILSQNDAYVPGFIQDLTSLLEAYESLRRKPDALPENLCQHIEQSKAKLNALFEWADGSLVHAMRSGHHFLLDEISLAEDSVLERLNSVLEPARTLFLAEKGGNDALIDAQSGFQFLATMNPGGDYGKRELSPALRNRFTEIWVPIASDQEEMLEIVQEKLVSSLIDFAPSMVEFAGWYAMTYRPAAPYISIRDLLSWIQFVNQSDPAEQFSALLHGAAMVYIDGLGADPASKLSIADTAVTQERQTCLLQLNALFGHDMAAIFNERFEVLMTNANLSIGPFKVPRSSHVTSSNRYSLQAPTTTTNAMKLIRALHLQKPILIEGSPGVGKTTLVAALAQAIGIPLTRINLSDQTDLMDLFGSDIPIEETKAGNFGWRDAPFLRAMQKGEWVLLDEMNLASQSILEGLNACLDHRGQVYVSELDQTFARHPSFAVFAAQNPHHQGGGRKGLPASFVNRFTVVYADNLTADDLSIISRDIYPNIPHNVTDNVIQSVMSLSQILQTNRGMGVQGGPWEINLRDALRWFQLLGSRAGLVAAATPADFSQLLFSQRFRTPRDVAVVSAVLQRYFPVSQPRNYYHGKGEFSIEVGIGLLPRDNLLQPVPGAYLNSLYTNLPIAESVMLCVQNRWPCLLVGASGCGKTQLIMQLASSVGADIVELSLNSDMDTTDLVGSYEQLDHQRQAVTVLSRLRHFNRKELLTQLSLDGEVDECLLQLEEALASCDLDVSKVVSEICRAAERYSRSNYPAFHEECQRLSQVSTLDNRARFEWTDGILVKALQDGKWLVLDNANLCSPSVLDRLNSLLEPHGFLSVNEHRNPDGSAQTIVPHPNFRLFMTMDPRHGELSRAMRNRSIELFMPLESLSPKFPALSSNLEPLVLRFEAFKAFDWNNIENARFTELLAICFDHLAFPDLERLQSYEVQVAKGLIPLSSNRQIGFSSQIELFMQLFRSKMALFQSIGLTYDKIANVLGLSHDFRRLQTIYPLNNSILLSERIPKHLSIDLISHGHVFDLLLGVYRYQDELASIAESAHTKQLAQLSKLERSMLSSQDRRFQDDSTRPLADFLRGTCELLQDIVQGPESWVKLDMPACVAFAKEILAYIIDLRDLAHSTKFEESVFQVYQTMGRSLMAVVHNEGGIQAFAHAMSDKLDVFKSTWQLCSGLHMEKLWLTFRPNTATDIGQLKFSLRIKALAGRFDALKWTSGASVQELDLLRSSIVRMHDGLISAHLQNEGSVADVENAISQLGNRKSGQQDDVSPYFQPAFETLCQYTALFKDDPSTIASVVDLLAGRSTSERMSYGGSSRCWNMLSQMKKVTAAGSRDLELAAIRGVLPALVLEKLGSISEVPLKSLDLLSTEIQFLSRSITSATRVISDRPLARLQRTLDGLRSQVKAALVSQLDPKELNNAKSQLENLHHRFNVKGSSQFTSAKQAHHLQQCLMTAVTSIDVEPSPKVKPANIFAKTSGAYIECFIGCLLLYVPDRAFDPAVRPKVERRRHNKRKAEIKNNLQALRDFEAVFSGQTTSLRIQLAEQAHEALGSEPQVPAIMRPEVSEVGQLQAEFNNILGTIVLRSPTLWSMTQEDHENSSSIKEVKLLRTNIAEAQARLLHNYHAYEDVTKPLVAMLQGLDLGLALTQISVNVTDTDKNIKLVCAMTPLLGASPQTMLLSSSFGLEHRRTSRFDPRLQFLKSFAMAQAVDPDENNLSTQKMFQTFHHLYEEWKDRLGEDQQATAAKSSFYRYRGNEDNSNETTEDDFGQLFPETESISKVNDELPKDYPDPRAQAQCVASLQRLIFNSSTKPSEKILDLLRDSSKSIAALWQEQKDQAVCPEPPEHLLPAVILRLDETWEYLHDLHIREKIYNFYTDAHLPEARKLVALIHKIQTRFTDLQVAWPEDARLSDVLRTSSELLQMRHTEPLAKLLTKTEQLHNMTHLWQEVASREYSAATLYDQLTSLIVSWRRLELSTWARLLDMEDQKCKDEADGWWFFAYESIVAAPLAILDGGEELYAYAEQLFRTVTEFLSTTSLGQYSCRLEMILCFQKYLKALMREFPLTGVIHYALTNLLSYHSRFMKSIEDNLHKGRQALEKDMREVLLLASWKDTTIDALRVSAKSSHHKLFKIVRKYRALLAQSSDVLLAHGIPEANELPFTPQELSATRAVGDIDPKAMQLCRNNLRDWSSKADRHIHTSITAGRMLHMSKTPQNALDVISILDNLGTELLDGIKTLQKETPFKATKETEEAIKHLHVRKRKLFSETLKALRDMGLRSNLSADTLARQASLSTILSVSPVFDPSHADSKAAEYYFHKLLSLIPKIKEGSRNHSDDLTHGEVARSTGYLDSIVSVVIRQRTALVDAESDAQDLAMTIEKIRNLWSPSSFVLKASQIDSQDQIRVSRSVLRWLSSIIEAGSHISGSHAKMSGIDVSAVTETLESWSQKILVLLSTIEGLPTLPDGLSSSQHEQVAADGTQLLEDFRSDLDRLTLANPGISFVLKQLQSWTKPRVLPEKALTNGFQKSTLADLDSKITTAIDAMLVAVQNVQETLSRTPSSEEDSSWLMRADMSMASTLKVLHLQEVNNMLQDAMSRLPHLEHSNDENLAVAGAIFAMAMPIINQYGNVQRNALRRFMRSHRSLCRLASILAYSFDQIVSNGFCQPADETAGEAGKTEKLEGGTGLGGGEGAEDISKDIEDDEDLTDIAQQPTNNHKEGIEDQEDAVNMDQDEMEGELGDISEKGEDDEESASEGGKDSLEEEAGKVDILDPSAVDEKLWDGQAEEASKEKKGSKPKGQAEKDNQNGVEAAEQQADSSRGPSEAEDDVYQEGAEESEAIVKEEAEQMDPHVQDGQNLELPEEMDLDKVDGSDMESVSGESDVSGMSDLEKDQTPEGHVNDESKTTEEESLGNLPKEIPDPVANEDDESLSDADRASSPVDTEPSDEDQDQENAQGGAETGTVDDDSAVPSDVRGLSGAIDQEQNEEDPPINKAQASAGTMGGPADQDESQAAAKDGTSGQCKEKQSKGQNSDAMPNTETQSKAFKQLGDPLEKWHRQLKEIQDASERQGESQLQPEDAVMADQDFEHLENDEAEANAQVLGAASQDQARALDEKALASEKPGDNHMPEVPEQEGASDKDEPMQEDEAALEGLQNQQEQPRAGAFVHNDRERNRRSDYPQNDGNQDGEAGDIDRLDNELSITHIQPTDVPSSRSAEEARRLWMHYESLTRDLSLSLTEQLRLILAPTLATKMRGDFRTGKRLNMKRIIPYIASQYKRDKIWMRRSIPSKRNYQIMLAVDDSKSMGDSGCGKLAMETLALVAKSLSMLEVGEICVVGFGREVHVAHEFDKPFSSETGSQIFQHFGFEQGNTDVRKLAADSITLFREARRKNRHSGADLWQLALVVSDGVFEDHDTVRRLVRQAQSERIMIIFIIVDNLTQGESITNMSQAVFQPDPTNGETQLKMERYLDNFPFPYYMVVGAVRELPGVLAQALRQWFVEVVDSN